MRRRISKKYQKIFNKKKALKRIIVLDKIKLFENNGDNTDLININN